MSKIAELAGYDLGQRSISYTDSDVILYALCVGAQASELPLVYERDLRVLPTFGLGLGLWAVEQAGTLGAYDRLRSLHAAQTLTVHEPFATSGTLDMRARIANAWDKGSAAMIDIIVECAQFTATYSIFLPGYGGWGGERGPSSPRRKVENPTFEEEFHIAENLPALYRLTGARHPVHIDPEVAASYGFDRPILHGLCTLGIAARQLAFAAGSQPWELSELSVRFAAPVFPGKAMNLIAECDANGIVFEARSDSESVLSNGYARF
ncbi:MaoC/PaaZ C-terminal domain-containing protein [Saccharomonospora viridis]|uniref:MaoC/PaaZ C-terminal domain-containing protein n=1 Tax=Saccharomonospora viridis TaxID=1852 RepID=UPI0024A8168B|nr:MaoC/PaaZ C-terminal domain-containing protein [Saccharomonospora viridis]